MMEIKNEDLKRNVIKAFIQLVNKYPYLIGSDIYDLTNPLVHEIQKKTQEFDDLEEEFGEQSNKIYEQLAYMKTLQEEIERLKNLLEQSESLYKQQLTLNSLKKSKEESHECIIHQECPNCGKGWKVSVECNKFTGK